MMRKTENDNRPAEGAEPTSQQNQMPAKPARSFSIRGRIIFATVMMLGVVGGMGAWAATAELSGAVIASGTVVVDKNVKKLQHRDGGIVSKISVSNGDRVKAGQPLIELDDTQIRAEIGIVRAQLTDLIARKARLMAVVEGAEAITFPKGFTDTGPHAKKVASADNRLFQDARTNLKGQKDQLELQIQQLQEEISGIESQRNAKNGQLQIMSQELAQIEELYKKKLTSVTRLYALQREAKRLRGEHGGLLAQIARSKGKISEIKLQILSLGQSSKLEAQRELQVTEAKISELTERKFAAEDRLMRTKMHAPIAGLVHELGVHTIGGVVTAAETVLLIVPEGEELTIEARIAPVDIDQVAIGRSTKLMFSAFNKEQTPELEGRIVHIAADVTTDPQTSQNYYMGRVEISKESREKLRELDLLPGMPVEVFISTGARTALSYLAKPITDQFNRAFREY